MTEPLLRDGGELRPVSWERALDEAARSLKRAGARTAALVGGQTTSEEGLLLSRIMREALGSPHLDSRAGGRLAVGLARALSAPVLQASVPDLEFAHAVLLLDCEPIDDAPILDLRLRKGIRRNGVRLAVASSRPSSLDADAERSVRFAPGAGAAFAAALDAALCGEDLEGPARAAGASVEDLRALAGLLREAGTGEDDGHPEIVILWGERLLRGPDADRGAQALLNLADRLRVGGADGAGLLEVPDGANGRGLREAGVLPNAGPGLADPPAPGEGRDAAAIAAGLAGGDLVGGVPAALRPGAIDARPRRVGSGRWRRRAPSSPTHRS